MENTVARILRDVSVDGFTELLCSFLYNYKCAPTRVYLFLVLVSFRCAHWVGGWDNFNFNFRSINSRRVSSMVIVGTKCLVSGSQMESLLVVSATIEVDNRGTACAFPIVKCS